MVVKIFVFTDEQGSITGSFRPGDVSSAEVPSFRPLGRSRDRVHEVELSEKLAQIKDPARLHEELQKLIPSHARS